MRTRLKTFVLALALIATAIIAPNVSAQAPPVCSGECVKIDNPAKPGLGENPMMVRPDFTVSGVVLGSLERPRIVYVTAHNINIQTIDRFLGSTSRVDLPSLDFGNKGWRIDVKDQFPAGDYNLIAKSYDALTGEFLAQQVRGPVHFSGCTARSDQPYTLGWNGPGGVLTVMVNQCTSPSFPR